MIYLFLKAFHITAVIVWVGGMTALWLALANLSRTFQIVGPEERRWLVAIQRWDRRVTSPALLLLWIFGLALASRGGWFGATWLWLKVPLAVTLSGLHGVLAGSLRRSLRDASLPHPQWAASAAWMPYGVIAVIILLVTFKF
ncbi:CopD family protein [Variovorax sp. 770b2]|uniref:CopD family protein n=1 Tax=Variovorax sp. 770b2 TaxID=1566271 RepID=UPI0008E20DB4|nr:CopD family protein [Variovorax sp. 770b2]SFQ32792.1 Uncharacterized membrane protein [Variovorax sp. 770b2]